MKINFRDSSLRYPMAIRDDKTLIVLDWLLEFRFSNYEILASRIDQSSANANRFFKRLADNQLIKPFKSVYASGRKFVMLDSNGVGFLESRGRSTQIAITRESRVGNYSNLMHDLAIQHIVLEAINEFRLKSVNYTDVIWDRHIKSLPHDVRPDALLKTSNGQLICFEVERYRKDRRKIYFKYRLHAENILNGKYKGVFYFFLNESDKIFYESLCNAPEWPFITKKEKDRGKLIRKSNDFIPEQLAPKLHKCFSFIHSPGMDINNFI